MVMVFVVSPGAKVSVPVLAIQSLFLPVVAACALSEITGQEELRVGIRPRDVGSCHQDLAIALEGDAEQSVSIRENFPACAKAGVQASVGVVTGQGSVGA